jgi:hypothetical protein
MVDVNPTFLRMFVSSLRSRAEEGWGFAFYYSAILDLFEELQTSLISPNNARYPQKVFVCLGSTIGNFGSVDNVVQMFSLLASPGDRLVVGYQTRKYLRVIFDKYRNHPGYRALIGNFLPAKERRAIEWKLNEETATVEAWYNGTQLFSSRKFSCSEVACSAERQGWRQDMLSLDYFENIALHGFEKR